MNLFSGRINTLVIDKYNQKIGIFTILFIEPLGMLNISETVN